MVWVFRGLFFLALGVLVQYSLMPNPSDIATAPAIYICDIASAELFADAIKPDKITHFLAYGLMGFLLVTARIGWLSRLAVAWALMALLGASLEYGQMHVANRYAELSDMLANSLGAGLGVLSGGAANAILGVMFNKIERP